MSYLHVPKGSACLLNSKSSVSLAGATSRAESAHTVCLNASQYALAVGMSSEIARAKMRAIWKGSHIGGCSGLLASKERVALASCAKRMNLKTFSRGSDGIGKDARRVSGGSAAMGTTVHEAGALTRGSRTAAQSDVPGSCRWIMPKLRSYNLQSNPTDLIFWSK